MLTRIKKIRILENCIYIMGYALILLLMSMIFRKTIAIDNSYLGLWGIIISMVIYFLNKKVKPIIFKLTLPITALTLGIFYPFINLFILKFVDFIFENHLTIKGIILPLFIAILISIMNFLMDEIVIKPIIKKGK